MIKADRTTCGIANKGFGGLRSSEIRFSFCNGRQERSPQSLTSHTTGTLCVILRVINDAIKIKILIDYEIFISAIPLL